MKTLCSCCHAPIAAPVVETRAGAVFPGLGLCRRCWRLVGPLARRALRRARTEYRAVPLMAQGLALYAAWEAVLAQATSRRALLPFVGRAA